MGKAWWAQPVAKVIGHREVYLSGVPPWQGGLVHRQPLTTVGVAQRTVCGSWPGREVGEVDVGRPSAVEYEKSYCPTCFKHKT